MAKQGITLPELKRALSSGPPALIYLVVGEEPFLRDAAVAEIQQHVLGPDVAGVAAFNMDVLYGADTDALDILRLCDTLPAFAERRLLIVRDAGALFEHPCGDDLFCDDKRESGWPHQVLPDTQIRRRHGGLFPLGSSINGGLDS